MSTSATSSEARVDAVRPSLAAHSLMDLVGRTPMIRLQRSGDGKVWVKREGRNPSGSFHDRVARYQLDATMQPVVVSGWSTHALAVLALAVSTGREVHHVVCQGEPPRLRALCSRFVARPERVRNAQELDAAIRSKVRTGCIHLEPDDPDASARAWRDVTMEVHSVRPVPPLHWVVSGCGVESETLRAALEPDLPESDRVHILPWDGGQERRLTGTAACRRQQSGHREGLLLSPLGAELIDHAVNVALQSSGDVCVVLPEDGHRYLGWW
ncbi:MAG: pyridoxal-phosphate dependent enzyme [Deltaproteobacteria bacterium]|nr:MAG: pyridoxal-phosphate dependent enzyme [Deltaproteobacteria bacterium]